MERLVSGERLSAREAGRLLPGAGAVCGPVAGHPAAGPGWPVRRGPPAVLRRLAAQLDGPESFLRSAVGVEVFAERGLVSVEVGEGTVTLRPCPGRKADLEQSAYVLRLRGILGGEERGGL